MGAITIAGQSIDPEDPCALYQALYAFKIRLVSGQSTEEIEVNSPVTKRRCRFTPANPAALDAEFDRLRIACEARSGRRQPSVVYINSCKGL